MLHHRSVLTSEHDMASSRQATLNADVSDSAALTVLDRKELLLALQRMRSGDFSVQLPAHWTGVDGKIADTFNEIVATNHRIAQELRRVGQVVGM
jgi:hypothetical protein